MTKLEKYEHWVRKMMDARRANDDGAEEDAMDHLDGIWYPATDEEQEEMRKITRRVGEEYRSSV